MCVFKKLLCVIILFSSQLVYSQCGGSSFQTVIGGIGDERAHDIKRTTDNGYIIAGETTSSGAGAKDIVLVKVDVNGVVEWSNTYGSASIDDGNSISVVQTQDGGYAIAGQTEGFGAGTNYDAFIIKVNGIGTVLWEQQFTGASFEGFRGIVELSNGDIIATGNTQSFGVGFADVFVVKLSATGSVLWSKAFGGSTGLDFSTSVTELANGDVLICAHSNGYGAGMTDALMFRIDNAGNEIWTKSYGGADIDAYLSASLLDDGNIIAVGLTRSFGVGTEDILLSKMDQNGVLIWSKTYGGTGMNNGADVMENSNGEIIVSGATNSFSGNFDYLLLSVDAVGGVNWSKTYGGSGSDEVDRWSKSLELASDTGILIVGGTFSFGAGGEDMYVVKTNSCGESFCNEQDVVLTVTTPAILSGIVTPVTTVGGTFVTPTFATSVANFNSTVLCDSNLVNIEFEAQVDQGLLIYPNPSSNSISIQYDDVNNVSIRIFNINAQLVTEYSFINSKGELKIDISKLRNGIYFLSLIDEDTKVVRKTRFVKITEK